MQVTPYASDELVLIVPRHHELAKRSSIAVGELQSLPLVSLNQVCPPSLQVAAFITQSAESRAALPFSLGAQGLSSKGGLLLCACPPSTAALRQGCLCVAMSGFCGL